MTDEEKKILEEQQRRALEREASCTIPDEDKIKLAEYFDETDLNAIVDLMKDSTKTVRIKKFLMTRRKELRYIS